MAFEVCVRRAGAWSPVVRVYAARGSQRIVAVER
jgi:hypothetical protein